MGRRARTLCRKAIETQENAKQLRKKGSQGNCTQGEPASMKNLSDDEAIAEHSEDELPSQLDLDEVLGAPQKAIELQESNGTVNVQTNVPNPTQVVRDWETITKTKTDVRRSSWADEVEKEEETERKTSIWDNFDISKVSNAGFKLEFVSPLKAGEDKVREIDVDDISTELEYWKNTITGMNEVLREGIYHFDNKPLIVKAWHEDMEFTKDELYIVPIWVKLPGLEFKHWGPKGLSKIGSLIGKPLMADSNTKKKIGLHFARLLIEVDVGAILPDVVHFKNEKGVLVEQKVRYDWKPILCKFCQNYGHNEADCRKKKPQVENVKKPVVNRDMIDQQMAPTKEVVKVDGVNEHKKETLVKKAGRNAGKQVWQDDTITGWTAPANTSRSSTRKEPQPHRLLNPFNVLSEGATSKDAKRSPVQHVGGSVVAPPISG
ncbi:hypothetical protein BC332_15895 [Capsicum chinense]|nr:hypothetical protein BC332_15895 [Capsicum chinense]